MQRFLSTFRQSKIQTKLVVYYLAFAVITIATVIYFAYTLALRSLETTVEEKVSMVAELKRYRLNEWVEQQREEAESLSKLPDLRSQTEKLLSPDLSLQDRQDARGKLASQFRGMVQRSATDLLDIQVIGMDGRVAVSSIQDLVGTSQAEQTFFIQGLSQTFTQDFYRSDLFDRTVSTVAVPLLDNSQKQIGVLALHFDTRHVNQIFENVTQLMDGSIKTYLVDADHHLITSTPFSSGQVVSLHSSGIELALQGEQGTAAYVSHTGVEVIGAYLGLAGQDAALLVEIDRATALQPARQLAANIGIIGLQISIILIVAVLIMAERIIAPLRALSETVARISQGQLNASAPVLAEDEVGALARAFNSMTEKLRQSFDGLQNELNERKQLESDLLQFRMVMDESNDAIFLIDPETSRCIDFNKSAHEFLGYSGTELQQLSILDIAEYVTSLDAWRERIDLIHETGSLVFETVYRRKNYTTFPVEISARMLYYGGRTLLLFVARDITLRKQSERELRESEERFRKVFQSSPVAISITALEDGRLLDANYAYWDLTGYVAEQVLGRNAQELKLWEDIRARAEFVEDLRRKGSLFNPDDHFRHTDGTLKYVISFHELMRIGHEDCVLSMFYDMSAQKRMMQALQQSEARIRALVDAFPDMIMELSRDGVILNVVPPKGTETRMIASQFTGKRLEEVFEQDVVTQTLLAMERVTGSNQIAIFEFDVMMGDKLHAMEARLSASASDTVLMMIRDFTQRRWAEQEREKLISELENKNAELERFAYTVSHDLKSPLFTIRGFLGYLEQDALSGNRERLRGDIQRITNATDRMQRLLSELLELSRIGRLRNESMYVNFSELVSEALELVHGRLMEHKIKVQVQTDLPQVYGDRPRLVEVLQNLLDNAAKFMGDQQQPYIEIGWTGEEAGMPIFYIRDNGMGIAPEYHDRIFGLFNKLDPKSDGTGVGLALVRRILEVHGGRVWIRSETGHGCTFFFTLPTQPHLDSVI